MARSWDARVKGASQKATIGPSGALHLDERSSIPPAEDDRTPTTLADTGATADEEEHPQTERREPANAGVAHTSGDTGEQATPPVFRRREQPMPADIIDRRTSAIRNFASADLGVDPLQAEDAGIDEPAESRFVDRRKARTAAASGLAEVLGTTSVAEVSLKRAANAELVAEGLSLAVQASEMAVAVVERSTGLLRWTSDAWIDRFGEKDLIARHMSSATEFGESPLPAPGESWQRTRTLIFVDGSEKLVDLLLVGAMSPDGTPFVTVVALEKPHEGVLITERAQVISIVDGAVDQAAEGSVAVLYVDLDRFKVIHDLVGNIEALRMLDLVHQRIAGAVRGTDLLFRLHSDEFVVVSCELEHAGAAEDLAERIRASVATLPRRRSRPGADRQRWRRPGRG